jgi:hypothetical protein
VLWLCHRGCRNRSTRVYRCVIVSNRSGTLCQLRHTRWTDLKTEINQLSTSAIALTLVKLHFLARKRRCRRALFLHKELQSFSHESVAMMLFMARYPSCKPVKACEMDNYHVGVSLYKLFLRELPFEGQYLPATWLSPG